MPGATAVGGVAVMDRATVSALIAKTYLMLEDAYLMPPGSTMPCTVEAPLPNGKGCFCAGTGAMDVDEWIDSLYLDLYVLSK
jgi:hypothetical protein